mmetsp:Transcript_31211/g.98528  ORF Transcript_31211/g.98528 Transcript_31211/m.98528 type:complete len:225 (-) Transcript_31211:586-1260(-)
MAADSFSSAAEVGCTSGRGNGRRMRENALGAFGGGRRGMGHALGGKAAALDAARVRYAAAEPVRGRHGGHRRRQRGLPAAVPEQPPHGARGPRGSPEDTPSCKPERDCGGGGGECDEPRLLTERVGRSLSLPPPPPLARSDRPPVRRGVAAAAAAGAARVHSVRRGRRLLRLSRHRGGGASLARGAACRPTARSRHYLAPRAAALPKSAAQTGPRLQLYDGRRR